LLWYHFESFVDNLLGFGCHPPNLQLEPFAKFAPVLVILPAHLVFYFQYQVRLGEQCGFTTKSTRVTKSTKRFFDIVPLFLCLLWTFPANIPLPNSANSSTQ